MRKERNTQNTGSNPVPTTTIFCNDDKSDSPSAFFLFTNTSYLEVSVMVAAVVGTNSVSGLNNPELSQMS